MRGTTRAAVTHTKDSESSGPDTLTESAIRDGDQASLQRVVQAKMAVPSPSGGFEEFSGEQISRRATGDGLQDSGTGLETSDDTVAAISRASSGGSALDPDTKSRFETGLGADLSDVRIHADGQSDTLCRSLSAEAFTTGSDVFFSSGAYQPGTRSGDHLLAHELTHVVQQGSAPVIARAEWKKDKKRIEADLRARRNAAKNLAEDDTAFDDFTTYAERTSQAEDARSFSGDLGDPEAGSKARSGEADSFSEDVVLGLTLAVKELFYAIKDLVAALGADSDDATEARRKSFGALLIAAKDALGVAEKSLSAATGLGASVATAAIPGLGIAIAAISAGHEAIKMGEAHRGMRDLELTRDDPATDESTKLALRNLIKRQRRQWWFGLSRLVGDITMLVGNIAVVATGPGAAWGVIVIGAGALIKGLTSAVESVFDWVDASKTYSSREAYNTAKEERDSLEQSDASDEIKLAAEAKFKTAEKRRLKKDATFAASHLVDEVVKFFTEERSLAKAEPNESKAAKVQRESQLAEAQKKSLKLQKAIVTNGVSVKLLQELRTTCLAEDSSSTNSQKEIIRYQMVDQILEAVGTSRNPKTFTQSLLVGLEKIGSFVLWIVTLGRRGKKAIESRTSESKTRIVTTIQDEIFNGMVEVCAKYSAKPLKPENLQAAYTPVYEKLMAYYAPPAYRANSETASEAKQNEMLIFNEAKALIMRTIGESNVGRRIDDESFKFQENGKLEYEFLDQTELVGVGN